MNRYILSLLVPPIAVCRYGCAGCCAAPIAVFWLAGIASLIYGYLGGPLDLNGVSWYTLGLGFVLWGIAALWAMVTVHNVNVDQCEPRKRTICGNISPKLDESDPMDEVRKAL